MPQIISPTNLGLVAHYSFDEGAGNILYDSSGNRNHGTLVNSPTWVQGIKGGALSFNGSNQYVTIPSISITNNITVSCWFVSFNNNQFGFLVSKSPVNSNWELFFEGGALKWRGASYPPEIYIIPPIVNKWHHAVITQIGTIAQIYIDGILVISATIPIIANGNGPILIGTYGEAYYFNGLIDEVRIYNRALSAQEVQNLYQLAA
jgi:hypothetical protein